VSAKIVRIDRDELAWKMAIGTVISPFAKSETLLSPEPNLSDIQLCAFL